MLQAPYRFVPVLSDVYRMGYRQAAKVWFAGSEVECPVCERTFARFRTGAHLGNCPYCGAAPRHRLLRLSLEKEWSRHPSELDVLHFAPEWGTERSIRLNPRVRRYVTVDLAAPRVDVRCDITALDFADASFDLIFCSHVLEHVRDDRKAISELRRVLRPGGVAYIQVPWNPKKHTDEDPSVTDPAECARRFGQFDHVRMYGSDLVGRLREPGFDVEQLRPTRSMTAGDIARFGLWDDSIFRCRARGAADKQQRS